MHTFTVIDVLRCLNIPLEPEFTWAAGNSWRREYMRITGGHEGELKLQPKTDPHATVKAAHGIRSYPGRYWDRALDYFRQDAAEAARQGDFFT